MNGRKIVPVPQNLSSFILFFQVWKNNSMFVCVSGVGANGDAFYWPEHHPSDRLQARAVASCHRITFLQPEKQQFSGCVALRLGTPLLLLVILLREHCWQ